MAFIDKHFVADKLIPAINIEEYIGRFLTLKKSGSNYVCCCPFHKEKTPSFNVVPSKQMYYCFGCHAHGNALDFLMKYKNLGFVDAVEELASSYGIAVEYDSEHKKVDYTTNQRFYELLDRVAVYFQRGLYENQEAYNYFSQKRQLSKETMVKYRLGYAPNRFDYLRKEVVHNDREYQDLIELGVVVSRNDNSYSMFRNRVMIPILDIKGRVIAFGGRTLGDDKPKYINSPESKIFKKRFELFGLYDVLKTHNNRPERIVIVEGYMDVIALNQAGIDYAVASLGTATTVDQFKLMFRYTNEIICCYDGDDAGRRAAFHALETITPVLSDDKTVRFAFLPPEHDPDTMVRTEGKKGFIDVLDKSLGYAEFLVTHEKENYNLADSNELARFIGNTVKQINKITVNSIRLVAVSLLSQTCKIEERKIYEIINNSNTVEENVQKVSTRGDFIEESKKILNTPMRELVAFILQQPNLVSNFIEELKLADFVSLCAKLKVKGIDTFAYFLDMIAQNGEITSAIFIERCRETKYEKMVNQLVYAELINKKDNGELISLESRAELFISLMVKVLMERIGQLSNEISLKKTHLNVQDEELIFNINRILSKRFAI